MILHLTAYFAALETGQRVGRISARYDKGTKSMLTGTIIWKPLWAEEPPTGRRAP